MTALVVRKFLRAPRERLFKAWTDPSTLKRWWGPEGVTCSAAEIELQIGGRYRIGNQLPDGRIIWISGVYEVIDPPSRLVFTWRLEHEAAAPGERVTVEFMVRGDETEVIVTHEEIEDPTHREGHERGWIGCLNGLSRLIGS